MANKSQDKNISLEDLSKLIVNAIESEQYFRKDILVPKVKAIMKAFSLNLNATRYNSIKSPSETAKILRALEQKEFEQQYWRNRLREIKEDSFPQYCKELDELLIEKNFK